MGLFSGKRRTHIQSTAQRMLEDKDFTYSSKLAMYQYLLENKSINVDLNAKSLVEYLMEASAKALPKQWDKAYRFAEKAGKYHFGLPTSSLLTDLDNQIIQLLSSHLEIDPSQLIEYSLGAEDYHYSVWQILVTEYGYDSRTNILETLSTTEGTECYLVQAEFHLRTENLDYDENEQLILESDTVSFDYHELPNGLRALDLHREPIAPIVSETSESVKITYLFLETYWDTQEQAYKTREHYKDFTLNLDHINPIATENQTLKSHTETLYATYLKEGQVHWFSYELFSGGISSIDTGFRFEKSIGEYYPRLYLRNNQRDIIDSPDTQIKKSVKRIFKKTNLNNKDITESLRKNVGSDYSDLRGAYLFCGLRINTSHHSKKAEPVIAEYAFRYFKRLYDLTQGKAVTQVIEDNLSKVTLSYDAISYAEHLGKKEGLDVGKAVIEYRETTHKKSRFLRRSKRSTTAFHTIYFQLSEERYAVLSLTQLRQHVWLSGFGSDHVGLDENLVIPLDRLLIKELTKKEKELLLFKGFHIQLMFVKITKVKWYERGAFKALLIAISIAVSIGTGGAGASLLSLARAALVSSLKAIAVAYASQILIEEMVEKGIIKAKHIGVMQFVISMVLMAHGASFDMSKLLTAPNIMKSVNHAFNAYQKHLTVQVEDIKRKLTELTHNQLSHEAKIEEARQLLETKVFQPHHELLLSNFNLSVDLFETPEMFYDRHHAFDVVNLSHGLITNFVQGANQLRPRLYHPKDDLEISL